MNRDKRRNIRCGSRRNPRSWNKQTDIEKRKFSSLNGDRREKLDEKLHLYKVVNMLRKCRQPRSFAHQGIMNEVIATVACLRRMKYMTMRQIRVVTK